jgi:thiol-disulfide isomerase/thioredoxin
MKRILLTLALGLGLLTANAQTSLTTAVDFTVTDVHGETHNLFSILNEGKHVIVDFFFTTCPPCIQSVPILNQSFLDYGCNTGEVFYISMDAGDTDAQVLQYELDYGGLLPSVSGIDGGGDAVNSAYGIGAYPTVVLIAPNHIILEQDIYPVTDITSALPNAGLNMAPCDTGSTTSIQEVDLYSKKCLKMFDLLGRELIVAPIGTMYIKNKRLYITK